MPRGTVSFMTLVRRGMQLVKREDAPADAPKSRVREFIASTDTVDSYNTRIIAEGIQLERYAKNSVVLLQHDSRSFPIGVGAARIEGGKFVVSVDFAPATDPVSGPEAEQALLWVDRGVMGMSIGFDVLEATYAEDRETGDPFRDLYYPPEDYTKIELFEVSVVSVPANPDALPVGRAAAAKTRFMQRMAASSPTAPVVPPQPQLSAPEIAALVERVVREHRAQKQSADLRRRGKTSRS